MAHFVFEIGFEEMPARFLAGLEQALESSLAEALAEANVAVQAMRVESTPRRLAVMVEDMDPVQKETEELVMGPPIRIAYDADGNPTKAALGFARTQGVEIGDAFVQISDKGQYLAVNKKTGGARGRDILGPVLVQVIQKLPFPKKMRWADLDITFGRPLRWLLAMLDDEVIPMELAGLESSNATHGHRVMSPGRVEIPHASEYEAVLADKAMVILAGEERKRIIRERGDALAQAAGGKVVWKDSLMDEVAGLVEYPEPVLGTFEESFLEVPREVLLISMQSHQKSFGIEKSDGTLMNHFLSTLNLVPTDVQLVTKGWERVLRARLEDARFFWKTDLAANGDDWVRELDKVIFLGPLGSMGDKSRRLERLCAWLAEAIEPALSADAVRAAHLAKADLVSEMVGEFSDLQGIMGGIFASRRGENETVSRAIYEHYLPAGQDSPVPDSMAGAILSMADKADTLVGCFGLKKIPTGANDPYALRRGVLGICRIILEKGLRIDLEAFFRETLAAYGDIQWKLSSEEMVDKLMEFTSARLKSYFISQGSTTLAVEAAIGAGISDVWALAARLQALDDFSREDDFGQAVLTFKRAGNIIRKQGGDALTGDYQDSLFEEDAEKQLGQALEAMGPRFDELWGKDAYAELMGLLRELRPVVDGFFDNVMVMCDDAALKTNRLNLLQALVSRLSRLADFNALQI